MCFLAQQSEKKLETEETCAFRWGRIGVPVEADMLLDRSPQASVPLLKLTDKDSEMEAGAETRMNQVPQANIHYGTRFLIWPAK